jgi:hypothetical protein
MGSSFRHTLSVHTFRTQTIECWVSLVLPPAMAQQPIVGQGLLIIEISRSYSDTPHLVKLLCASDQPVAETSDNTPLTRDIHAPVEMRTQTCSKRAASDPCLRLHDRIRR